MSSQDVKNWTIIYYAVGSNSSETDLMRDVEEMKRGKTSTNYNLVLLIDRIEGFSEDESALDGNFTDTRLYQIEHNTYKRLDGHEYLSEIDTAFSSEINMGDASNLRSYIQYCKTYFPAEHYMLILRSHGNGMGMCPDAEHGSRDALYPAELTNTLTKQESVDILGLDVCSMAGLENLYQWRPENQSFSADYVIASAPLSGAWEYDRILERLDPRSASRINLDTDHFEGGEERVLDAASMSPMDFSKLIMEEIFDNQRWASWGLFDNTKIEAVKLSIDKASKLLALEELSDIESVIESTIGYHHSTSDDLETAQLTFPYLDAYDFWRQVSEHMSFKEPTKKAANAVCRFIDELVVLSYYGQGFLPETDNFQDNASGVYQIIPRGNQVYSYTNRTFWSHCGWYSPDDQSGEENSFGQYSWCSDGAVRGNNEVENFYELLDYLFDKDHTSAGGVNNYQW